LPEKQKRATRLYERTQVIHVINSENPRREGSNRFSIFECLKDGMTVNDFLTAADRFKGGNKDLQLLEEAGYISID
jgi:hypothetical protein